MNTSYLLSYQPGMSGDFIASNVHQDKKFYDISSDIRDHNNRYWFPCLTRDITSTQIKHVRNYESMPFTDADFLKFNQVYKDKNVVFPTHWYSDLDSSKFEVLIRLYTDNPTIVNISYAMWWIKSHATSSSWPWNNRLDEIHKIPSGDIKDDLITKYHNWKYLAYKFNIPIDFDIYVKEFFNRIYYPYATSTKHNQFRYLDLNTLYTNELTDINEIFGTRIDEYTVQEYTSNNIRLLQENDIKYESESFLDSLIPYLKTIMADSQDLTADTRFYT